MRRFLIRNVLPLVFCAVPVLAACLVALALPVAARVFYLDHISTLDRLILGLGAALFLVQLWVMYWGLRVERGTFNPRSDRWISNLAQAAEWFPLLGLLGTVAGILQTFSAFGATRETVTPNQIISSYAPAITATGSGLFMALVNILPTWMVMVGRDVILALGGEPEKK